MFLPFFYPGAIPHASEPDIPTQNRPIVLSYIVARPQKADMIDIPLRGLHLRMSIEFRGGIFLT
jgi:hypothetical protein